jgi:hypothetical protein
LDKLVEKIQKHMGLIKSDWKWEYIHQYHYKESLDLVLNIPGDRRRKDIIWRANTFIKWWLNPFVIIFDWLEKKWISLKILTNYIRELFNYLLEKDSRYSHCNDKEDG